MQAKSQAKIKTINWLLHITLTVILLWVQGGLVGAEEFNSSKGFFIDLPEGFIFVEGDGSTRFSFSFGSISIDLLVSDADRYSSARLATEDTAKRLNTRMTPSVFSYAGQDAAVAEFSFGTGQSARRGMAFFLDGEDGKEAKSSDTKPGQSAGTSYDLTLLAHVPASDWQRDQELILSCIDGFSASAAHRASPGPLGTLARAGLKPSDLRQKTIHFESKELTVGWNPQEAAIAQALVEREYRVLVKTTNTQAAVEPGMKRFYRLVWRDSLPSLDQLALILSKAYEARSVGLEDKTTSGGPKFGPPADPRSYAQALLKWTQGFNYERDPRGSDVVNPLSAAFEQRGDCDSRILVLNILLRRENIESILMISLKHEHALLAVNAPGIGARYPYRGGQWLVGETTAPVDIGRIDAKQANPADWFALDFPF